MNKLISGFLIGIFLMNQAFAGDWKYSSSVDKMRKESSSRGTLVSKPNGSKNPYLSLFVEKVESKKDILVGFITSQNFTYGKKFITVKLDDGELIKESVIIAGNMIAINQYTNIKYEIVFDNSFYEKIKIAKNMIVEVSINNDDYQQYEFDLSGLEL